MQALEELEDDTNKTLRALHRHPRRIETVQETEAGTRNDSRGETGLPPGDREELASQRARQPAAGMECYNCRHQMVPIRSRCSVVSESWELKIAKKDLG